MSARTVPLPLLVVLVSLGAGAAEPPKPSNVVLLEAVGNLVDVEALHTSLEDWLRSMKLELHRVEVLPPPDEAVAFARVRVVWSDETCVVEIFGPAGELQRRKSLPRGGPALLISESAALIAQAGVQELALDERRRPLPPASIAAVIAQPVTAPEKPRPDAPFSLGLGAYAQARAFGAVAPVLFGGGVEAAATFGDGPWHPQLSLLVAYQGVAKDRARLLDLELRMQTVSFRLLPSVRRRWGPFELDLGLGGGLDLLITSATSDLAPPSLRPEGVDAAPFFTAAVGVRYRVTSASALFLRASVDLDPARRRYRIAIADQRESLLVPWQLRPGLQLGFSFDLLSRVERSP